MTPPQDPAAGKPPEVAELERIWAWPTGWRRITTVNNEFVGLLYVGTALLFFVLAGVLAAIMRAQLAVPANDLVDHELYNQLFTMHGTIMMFLFAVPAVEAAAVYLLPNVLGARDLPYPRLSAYAYWAYALGGTAFFCSIFFGLSPNGGWFMYPPLTSSEYSPGINADFWLLGIGFIEISAIAGAMEIIVGILRTRAPGMTLDRLPIYAWAMLAFGLMVVFGFPAVILGTALLELERALHWPFFDAARGGDPLLWQHLFWFFGHPEVYIIFLPAAGFVSMILPTMAQTPLAGYRLVVLAILATAFLSFGLWVHHMFTTGIPALSASFFSAASMAVSVPSGIQVFAWIACIARGKLRLHTPALFLLGFLFIFVLGGLSGVMVAMTPFDFQAHDTYFVVAHFHYVLIGGMVFPFFAALYYWLPQASKRTLSERLGKWVFALLFLGVNVTFFPMHISGLMGMPRRVYTYPEGLGWDTYNLISSLGVVLIAAAVVLFLFDVFRRFRFSINDNPGNVWQAGTLEWAPTGIYGLRSIPEVRSRDPLWEQPELAKEIESGQWYLPRAVTHRRETIVTTWLEGRPEHVHQLPGSSIATLVGAVFTAAFFVLLTVKLYTASIICGVLALAGILRWMWTTDTGNPPGTVEVGRGLKLPVQVTGPRSVTWWGVIVLMLVLGTIFASMIGSYLYLWLVNPGDWPPDGVELPPLAVAIGAIALYALSSVLVSLARRALPQPERRTSPLLVGALAAAMVAGAAAFAIHVLGIRATGLTGAAHAYGAAVHTVLALQGVMLVTLLIMGGFVAARSLAGILHTQRRLSMDNTWLMWHYMAGQGIVAVIVTELLPRLLME